MKRFITVLGVLLCITSLMADVIHVPADQPTIQGGIAAAVNGDTVLVAEGTYLENINYLGKAITVASHYIMDGDTAHIANTIIDGSQPASANRGSVVIFNAGTDTTSVLSGFTVTGGTGSYWAYWNLQVGGGIWIEGGAKITHNHIVNNSVVQYGSRAPVGGGICIQTGYPTALPNGRVIVQHNRIAQNSCSGNQFVGGGGIAVLGYGTSRIASNTITQNSISADNPIDWVSGGGGIFIWDAPLDIIKNVISDNDAPYGGGIAASSDIYGFSIQAINNTIADNDASEKGGGVYLFNGYCHSMNNIFWGNTAPEDPDIFYRGNLNISYSMTQGVFPGTGNLQADPLFANSAYHLSDLSPAIDGGNPEPRFNDPEDPNNPGQPLWPAKGTLRADMGAFGGNDTVTVAPEAYSVYENFLYRQFGSMPYRFAYPLNYDSTLSYPLTVVLHGLGVQGSDNEQQLIVGLPWRVNSEYFGYDEFTIVPQNQSGNWHNGELQTVYNLIRNTIVNYPIDTTRIVVTGHSMGGGGSWQSLKLYPHFFAAAIPVSGVDRGFGNIKHVPVWVHHGTADANVSVNVSRDYISMLEATGLTALYPEDMSDPEIQAAIDNHARLFYSEYAGARHYIVRHAYENYLMFEWLRKQRRPVIRPINSSTNKISYQPGLDSVHFTTRFSNPHNLSYEKQLILENFDKVKLDTLPLFDDGLHGDSLAQDGIWGNILPPFQSEDMFRLGVQVNNTALGDTFYFHDLAAFTTSGPVTHEQHTVTLSPPIGIRLSLTLKNHALQNTVRDVSAEISVSDPGINIFSNPQEFGDIAPGDTAQSQGEYVLRTNNPPSSLGVTVRIFSNGYYFWSDSFTVVVSGLSETAANVPTAYSLHQNYPNPFNPSTTIEFALAKAGFVTLKIYNVAGEKVTTLVSENLTAGSYKYHWDASGLPSGIYFYRLEAGRFKQTRKLVLLR